VSETVPHVMEPLLGSALLRADLEALLEAIRRAEGGTEPEEPGALGYPCVAVRRERWEQVLERADLLAQSYTLAKTRGAVR
jgi:hypothetical protein